MAISEVNPSQENEDFEDDDNCCMTDDSGDDPTFDIVEETRSALSKISLKKSTPRVVKDVDSESDDGQESLGVAIPQLNENDGKCFEKVEELIRDGQVDKLKVDQCKVYLRKYGLRLTGNKGVLIARIKEHLEVINGGGEMKYAESSFVWNCKGDACTGDVVIFEQNVYEMFSIASQSAIGPASGTRTVAGRIVKESYGAAKQQHTFTIEVLWSKGEKPLPYLYPLLIKGRNLYRLKTMRQKWADEEERRKVLQEKHTRGSFARCSREKRIREKEMRKMNKIKRTSENKNDPQRVNPVQINAVQKNIPQLNHPQTNAIQEENIPKLNPLQMNVAQKENIQSHEQQSRPNVSRLPNAAQVQIRSAKPASAQQQTYAAQVPNRMNCEFQAQNQHARALKPCNYGFQIPVRSISYQNYHKHQQQPQSSSHYSHHQQSPMSSNSAVWGWGSQRQQHCVQLRRPCCYYHQGRCYYGENCKYLHE